MKNWIFNIKMFYGKLPFLTLGSAEAWQSTTLTQKSLEEIKWRNIPTHRDTSGRCLNRPEMSGWGKDHTLPQQQATKGAKKVGFLPVILKRSAKMSGWHKFMGNKKHNLEVVTTPALWDSCLVISVVLGSHNFHWSLFSDFSTTINIGIFWFFYGITLNVLLNYIAYIQ